jgi:cell division protein FtsZ
LKSFIADTLRQVEENQRLTQTSPAGPVGSQEDAELEKMLEDLRVDVRIFGCGGGGSNTINRLVESGIHGAELFALNTDASHLLHVNAPHKVLLGKRLTRGLGAGALPQVGEEAAKEAEEDIRRHMASADIAFVTCGLGGGTGTGSAPVVAKMAKDAGALTISVVTLPFSAEGHTRMQNAQYGLDALRRVCDTVLVIPNDKLLEIAPKLPLDMAFKVADEVLMRAIRGITEMITTPGLVNLDFNDLKTIMQNGGMAMVGIGESNDPREKAQEAVKGALNSPLIDVDISQAHGALVDVRGGDDMTIQEAEGVVAEIGRHIHPQARIIWGASVVPSLQNTMQVMVVMTGVTPREAKAPVARAAQKVAAPPASAPAAAPAHARGGGGGSGAIDFIR